PVANVPALQFGFQQPLDPGRPFIIVNHFHLVFSDKIIIYDVITIDNGAVYHHIRCNNIESDDKWHSISSFPRKPAPSAWRKSCASATIRHSRHSRRSAGPITLASRSARSAVVWPSTSSRPAASSSARVV